MPDHQLLTNAVISVPDLLPMPSAEDVEKICILDGRFRAMFSETRNTSIRTLYNAYKTIESDNFDTKSLKNVADPLEEFVPDVGNDRSIESILGKNVLEYGVYRNFLLENYYNSICTPSNLVRSVHFRIFNERHDFRKKTVYISKDSRGNLVRFPPYTRCCSLIDEIEKFTDLNSDNILVCAAVLLVGIVHCHPFLDGNGRLSRIVFNLYLSHRLGHGHYIPLSLISELTGNSFILKVRRAMHGAEWEQMCLFLCDALSISAECQK